LLVEDEQFSTIDFYPDPRPDPGDEPEGDLLASVQMTHAAGTVNAGLFQLQLAAPIEAQITGANPATGTTTTWARIIDGSGAWWADVSVSDGAGSGEIKVVSTLLLYGAYVRVTSFVFQG